jgi:uncharacterized protein (TIGR03086 family)
MATGDPQGELDTETYARANFQVAGEAFDYMADFLDSIGEAAWSSPTQCEKWDLRTLADHALGEAVYFPNLMRNALRGEEMYLSSLYDEMKTWSRERLVTRLREAAGEFPYALGTAAPGELNREVDLGWARVPIWQATHTGAMEGVFHGWDARAVLQPEATIPTAWAVQIDPGLVDVAHFLAHRKGIDSSSGTFRLQVGDGIGPVTVTVYDGQLSAQRGASGTADVTVHLTAEQFGRLICGRLKIGSTKQRDQVTVDGDRDRAFDLNRIFAGIANEED